MTKEELGQMISEHGSSLYSFCCHLTGCRQDADDLYQDTFLKAFELSSRIEVSHNPKSYIMGIALRLWQNERRKRMGRQRILPLQEYREEKAGESEKIYENPPEEKVIRDEQRREVRQAVDRLPDKIRTTMLLYYTGELSVEEISKTLRIPVGTVKSRMNKGRNMIKQYWEVYEDGKRANG